MNIDFNKIKKITLKEVNTLNTNKDYGRYFFGNLISFNNIENNLICLKIFFIPNEES